MIGLHTKHLGNDDAESMAQVFLALSFSVRVKILNFLITEGAKTSIQIQNAKNVCGGLAQPTVSHHLNLLNRAGLIDRRTESTNAVWSVNTWALRRLQDSTAISIVRPR